MIKTRTFSLALGAGAAALIVAGCGGASTMGASSSGATPAKSSASGPTVAVKHAGPGTVLVDSSGRTLYLFEADKTPKSTCYGACASIWPPLLASGAPKAGAHVLASELGTTKRSDGKSEVTYNGHPLYYYVGDARPGQTKGQALDQFGAEWYVLAPSGKKIDES
jgi:predicted lipoprotein with Yx(FWY)xxD motif